MPLDQKSMDMTIALLMIPLVNKLLDRVKNKEYTDTEFQEIVDYYFRFRRTFEDTNANIRRGVVSF
jgi:hypothetical protein